MQMAEREFDRDHNLIALGDCNIDRVGDALFEAFTSANLTPAPQLEGLPRTIFEPGAEHFYDQIAWFSQGQKQRPVLRLEAVAGGQVDFVDTLQGVQTRNDLSWHITSPTTTRSGWSSRSQGAEPRQRSLAAWSDREAIGCARWTQVMLVTGRLCTGGRPCTTAPQPWPGVSRHTVRSNAKAVEQDSATLSPSTSTVATVRSGVLVPLVIT